MSHDLDLFNWMLSCMNPQAVALSVLMEVAGWGCPIAVEILCMGNTVCELWKTHDISASAADAIICLKVWYSM